MILGGGVTGLAAGAATSLPVYEAATRAGGICASYYCDGYRFEVGGGHWIFGDPLAVTALVPCNTYSRRASVRLEPGHIPYPIQAHIDRLGDLTARMVRQEQGMKDGPTEPASMKEWMRQSFGPTLCRLFFDGFNELYTAGLYSHIAPQDTYKAPRQGQGYNTTFVYPQGGLDKLVAAMAGRCDVRYRKCAVKVDTSRQAVLFEDGSEERYKQLISTLPLHKMLRLCGLNCGRADPHTWVIVLNIGAERGPYCPDDHWVYFPKSKSGFHRVGFYSNVGDDFAPAGKVSIYVERAAFGPTDLHDYALAVVAELKELGYIGNADIVDESVVDVAYTWRWPGSTWRERAIATLQRHGVQQLGRYGRWHFQGIAESIAEGMQCKSLISAV